MDEPLNHDVHVCPSSQNTNTGLIYVLLMLLSSMGLSIALHQYFHMNFRIAMQVRGRVGAGDWGEGGRGVIY